MQMREKSAKGEFKSGWREAAEAMELDLRPVLKPVGLLLKSEELCLTMAVAFALDYLAAELVEDFLILLTGVTLL